jgi:hypothetical protein
MKHGVSTKYYRARYGYKSHFKMAFKNHCFHLKKLQSSTVSLVSMTSYHVTLSSPLRASPRPCSLCPQRQLTRRTRTIMPSPSATLRVRPIENFAKAVGQCTTEVCLQAKRRRSTGELMVYVYGDSQARTGSAYFRIIIMLRGICVRWSL